MQLNILTGLVLAVSALTVSGGVSAADNTIETVVVEATRLSQTLHETGTSVFVIDGQDIAAQGYDFVVDALAAAPGVTINQNGTFGGSATVRIRGASSNQTLVLVDGVVVNDPSSPGGGFNFARLDPGNIDRIEILRGPQSTLWGSDAIGGVVSIVTKQPADSLQGSAFFEYGSEATARGGVDLSAANALGDFRLGVVSVDSEGISKADENNGNTEEDGYKSTSTALQAGINLPADARLQLSLNQTSAEAEFDAFSFGAQGSVADGDELNETEELNGQLTLTVPLIDGRLINTLTVGYSDIERDNFTNGVRSFSAEGDRQLYRYQGRYRASDQHSFAFGLEREEAESDDSDTSIDSVYGLYELKPVQDLTLSLGLRSDDVEDAESEMTGRVAVAYQWGEQVTLRGSWGQGFKAPTLFQNTFFCCGASTPNTDLQPEESDAYDVGVDWRSASGDTTVGVTYFDQDTKNQIDFSFAIGGYENIARVESEGVELSLAHAVTDSLSMTLNYAYIDAVDGSGEALIRIPEHTADLTMSYQVNDKLALHSTVRFNDEESNGGTSLDSWTRADVSAQYLLSEQLSLFARIENIADTEYQQILGYGTPDRSYSLGIRARF